MSLSHAPLGKSTEYIQTYTPGLLYPVPRALSRDPLEITQNLPFQGCDIWNGYEISWLSEKGKPEIALGEFRFPCNTPCLIESKSFKLYLNSFNQSSFDSLETVRATMQNDLSKAAGGEVTVTLYPLSAYPNRNLGEPEGICIDALDISADRYEVSADLLTTEAAETCETLYSNLLKSNCLATGQPDWGSVWIRYRGKKISHVGLLRYIISYRNHAGFAEHCAEQMFCDLMERCCPDQLTLSIRYTRRGGLDINPYRSNFEDAPKNEMILRQ